MQRWKNPVCQSRDILRWLLQVRYHNCSHASAVRCSHTVVGVFKYKALLWRDLQQLRCRQKNIRSWFAVLNLVATYYGGKFTDQLGGDKLASRKILT